MFWLSVKVQTEHASIRTTWYITHGYRKMQLVQVGFLDGGTPTLRTPAFAGVSGQMAVPSVRRDGPAKPSVEAQEVWLGGEGDRGLFDE